MAFSDNAKRLREEKQYTQAELGKMVGVSQQVIGDYEKGKKLPTIVTGVDLARALDTTVEKLVEGDT